MNEGETLSRAVVCAPGPAWAGATDRAAHNLAGTPDAGRSASQHQALVHLMVRRGVEVGALPEPEGRPNATFTRDPALVTRGGCIRLRMGLPTRRGEPGWLGAALDSAGVPPAGTIEAPGTLEGGDVILAGDVAFTGRSRRSNDEGIRQLSALLRPMGYRIRVANVPDGHLHLGGLMSVVGPRRVVAVASAFDASFLAGFEVVGLPARAHGPSGANVLCLGPDEVVANTGDGAEAIQALEAHGVRVHGLDLSEFRKGNGGPTCLVLPVERG